MRILLAPLLVAAALLVPGVAAAGAVAPFEVGPGGSQSLRLVLAEEKVVGLTVRFQVGSARGFAVDGPGACDLDSTATAVGAPGGAGASIAMRSCRLPAGTHDFTVRMGIGYARGTLSASHGAWA